MTPPALDPAKPVPGDSLSVNYTTAAPTQTTAFKNFDYRVVAIGAKGYHEQVRLA